MILSYIHIKKVKFYLVFFCALTFLSCTPSNEGYTYKLQLDNGKATSVIFTTPSDIAAYEIFVKGNTNTAVLGSFSQENGKHIFEPAIPFSQGQAYELKEGGKTLFVFVVPTQKAAPPEVLAVYPSTDTVPENVLKMYFVFSKPMQEVGNMLDYITVYNKTDQKKEAIFLSLENELWNTAHTQLTLWLDPGRIKEGLIPNKEKGLPILKGKEYEITIAASLKDAQGVPLSKSMTKSIYVTAKDRKQIYVAQWTIKEPKLNSRIPLEIDFKEPLDAILATKALTIYNDQKEWVQGTFKTRNNERSLTFEPTSEWLKGTYTIVVNEYLEDIAGNNLKHLFDKDLSKEIDTAQVITDRFTFIVK